MTRRVRTPMLFVVLTALAGMVAVAAARCPTDEPAGFGLLQFGGDADSVALEVDAALGINPLFTWAELEPAEGVHNWAPVDEALRAAHASGRKVAPRVYTNEGDFSQATPDWVFAAGAQAYSLGAGSTTAQPVPTDDVFTAKFAAFLAAFGARYDGHPAIEFVQTNAGMGAYGEMVWWLDESSAPPGYSHDEHIATMEWWVNAWRDAFPTTPLVLMQNYLGHRISETVSDYAASRGFYLQSNSVGLADESAAILAAHDGGTKIVLEVENNGCQGATGAEFEALAAEAFSQGFAIDYLVVCGETLTDAGATQRALDRLRRSG